MTTDRLVPPQAVAFLGTLGTILLLGLTDAGTVFATGMLELLLAAIEPLEPFFDGLRAVVSA